MCTVPKHSFAHGCAPLSHANQGDYPTYRTMLRDDVAGLTEEDNDLQSRIMASCIAHAVILAQQRLVAAGPVSHLGGKLALGQENQCR